MISNATGVRPDLFDLSVIIPTAGRETLARTLASVVAAGATSFDEVIVAIDGHHEGSIRMVEEAALPCPWRIIQLRPAVGDWGASPRNEAIALASRGYLTYMDDDDIYATGAFDAVRRWLAENPAAPHLFRFRVGDRLIWKTEGRIAHGDVGGHCFVTPNDPERLAPWAPVYEGDYHHIRNTLDKYPNGAADVVWADEVIAIWRP